MSDPVASEGPGEGMGRSGGSSGGFGKSYAFSVGRGMLLIAVAIIIGVVLLQLVDDGSGPKQPTTATSTTVGEASGSTTTTAKDTTGTTKPLTPTSEVNVLVLNATGVSGVAKSISDKLGAAPLSYKMQTPGNADKTTGTVVYYASGFEAEAAAMATAVNAATQGVTGVAGEAKVEPLPDPLPAGWTKDNVSKVQLVVVVGAR